jgi:hypothetical protein
VKRLKTSTVVNKLKNGENPMDYVSYFYNRDVLMAAISCDNHRISSLIFAPNHFRDDKEVAKYAISKNVYALSYISDRLKDDDEIFDMSINYGYSVLINFSMRIQNKRENLEKLKKFHMEKDSSEGDNLSLYKTKYFNWYKEKMEILKNYEENDCMKTMIDIDVKKEVEIKKLKF